MDQSVLSFETPSHVESHMDAGGPPAGQISRETEGHVPHILLEVPARHIGPIACVSTAIHTPRSHVQRASHDFATVSNV